MQVLQVSNWELHFQESKQVLENILHWENSQVLENTLQDLYLENIQEYQE